MTTPKRLRGDKLARAKRANDFIGAIASCGRCFFAHRGRVSKFDVRGGRVFFIDAYSGRAIYTHYNGRWNGFSQGGTLRDLVTKLRDFIRTGTPQRLNLGPWPEWYCAGDLWDYGDDMQKVRDAAKAAGVTD